MKRNNLWNASEVSLILQGKKFGSLNWIANDVSIDSRTTKKGDLFIALRGPKFDGHKFLNSAFNNGAVAAIVEKIPSNINDNNFILVKNTFKALKFLGIAGRENHDFITFLNLEQPK